MRKIDFILLIFVFLIGCSVIKKGNRSNYETTGNVENSSLIINIEKKNLTNNNFFIQKADIEVSTDEENQKFSGSIKFAIPGTYLISLRSKAGIEAARIFLTKDTLLINDRINRKLYYGKPEYLKRRYGISASILPVILGDFLKDSKSDSVNTKCFEGRLNLEEFVNGLKIRYIVDCKKEKAVLVTQESILKVIDNEIKYSDFVKQGNVLTPAKIQINNIESMTRINIMIKKIELPWNGSIEFIPGNKYELIELR